jgi:hypothetical protein
MQRHGHSTGAAATVCNTVLLVYCFKCQPPSSPPAEVRTCLQREDVPVHRGPLLGRFAAVAQAIEVAAQPAGERHRG